MTVTQEHPAAPSFDALSTESRDFLKQIPDYPLDFNIFVFRGIHGIRPKIANDLKEFRLNTQDLPIIKDEEALTSTSQLQDRLLQILLIERHRRDIELLNAFINQADPNREIKAIKLQDPLKYEIKSPIYKKLQTNADAYEGSFKKFAILQNLEFDFEKLDLTDDDLISEFLSDDILKFNEIYLKDGNEAQLEDIFEKIFQEGKFIRIVIPLAAQSILMGVDIEELQPADDSAEETED